MRRGQGRPIGVTVARAPCARRIDDKRQAWLSRLDRSMLTQSVKQQPRADRGADSREFPVHNEANQSGQVEQSCQRDSLRTSSLAGPRGWAWADATTRPDPAARPGRTNNSAQRPRGELHHADAGRRQVAGSAGAGSGLAARGVRARMLSGPALVGSRGRRSPPISASRRSPGSRSRM